MHIKNERRCIACREAKQQSQLIRIAKCDNNIVIDKFYKLGGRGAYVCKNNNCILLAIKKKALNKAFKMQINDEIYEELKIYEQNN